MHLLKAKNNILDFYQRSELEVTLKTTEKRETKSVGKTAGFSHTCQSKIMYTHV